MRLGDTENLSENLSENLEERTDQLLEAVMRFDDAKIENFYNEIRPGVNVRDKMRELADRAVENCRVQRKQPKHLQEALTYLAQLELRLEIRNQSSTARQRILIIDDHADRLWARKKAFEDSHFETAITTDLAHGLELLESGEFQLVILDHHASTPEERTVLRILLQFNLQIPVVNIPAIEGLVDPDARQTNRGLLKVVLRLFGRRLPKNTSRERRPPSSDESLQSALAFEPERLSEGDLTSNTG